MIIEMAKYSNTILLPVEAWAGNSHMQALWQFLQSTWSPGSVVDFRGLNASLLWHRVAKIYPFDTAVIPSTR